MDWAGNSEGYGAMIGRREDLSGRVFGNLTVLPNYRHLQRPARAVWLTVCTCGARTWKAADNLKRGYIKSCGNEHRWRADGD